MGGSDGWDPTLLTKQVAAPRNVSLQGNTLSWDASENAIGYAICLNDSVMAFTCNTSYILPTVETGAYTVRAANEMGGLGAAGGISSAIELVTDGVKDVKEVQIYDMLGRVVAEPVHGVNIVKRIATDGSVEIEKIFKE